MKPSEIKAARALIDANSALLEWCVKNIHTWDFPQWDNAKAASDALAKLLPQIEVWRDDTPAKPGVYRVQRVGKASAQKGYSHWNGERWGFIWKTRKIALKYIDLEKRKSSSKYPMQWAEKGGAA